MSYSTSFAIPWWAGLVSTVITFGLMALGNWPTYKKCGEQEWKALIPIYHIYTEFKLFWGDKGKKIFIILLIILGGCFLLSLVAALAGIVLLLLPIFFIMFGVVITFLVFMAMLYYYRVKSFNMSIGWFIIILIGMFCLGGIPTIIFCLVNGFGSSTYYGSKEYREKQFPNNGPMPPYPPGPMPPNGGPGQVPPPPGPMPPPNQPGQVPPPPPNGMGNIPGPVPPSPGSVPPPPPGVYPLFSNGGPISPEGKQSMQQEQTNISQQNTQLPDILVTSEPLNKDQSSSSRSDELANKMKELEDLKKKHSIKK